MVQSNHAALEAGILFGDREQTEPSSLIVIAIKNKAKLEKVLKDLEEKGIKHIPFIEPDWNYNLTSIATEPLTQEKRMLLKKYQLWKFKE